MKSIGLVVSDNNKIIFENYIFENLFFWPRDLLMQPIGTVWKKMVGDHPEIIPVEFGRFPISGSGKKSRLKFSLYNSM